MSSFEFSGTIGHLSDIESPWGNAGGVVRTVEEAELMARTGVGWVEAGSYTRELRAGNGQNGETVYWHNPETGETFNALGMPNKGMDVVETEIPEMARIVHARGSNKKLVVNVAPVSDRPVGESVELVRRAYVAGADAVLLNTGCPNVIEADGGRHQILSYSFPELEVTLSSLKGVVEKRHPIFVRLSPYESAAEMIQAMQVVCNSGVVSAVFLPNSWPERRPVDGQGEDILQVPGGLGGVSGPAMAIPAAMQTQWAVESLWKCGIDVVSSSGIRTARELDRRLALGAVAGAGTTFYYESPDWQGDTDRLLHELVV
jgi:dihydroorotate dehydrogenase